MDVPIDESLLPRNQQLCAVCYQGPLRLGAIESVLVNAGQQLAIACSDLKRRITRRHAKKGEVTSARGRNETLNAKRSRAKIWRHYR